MSVSNNNILSYISQAKLKLTHESQFRRAMKINTQINDDVDGGGDDENEIYVNTYCYLLFLCCRCFFFLFSFLGYRWGKPHASTHIFFSFTAHLYYLSIFFSGSVRFFFFFFVFWNITFRTRHTFDFIWRANFGFDRWENGRGRQRQRERETAVGIRNQLS